jgi:hypothetical protein
MEQPTPHIFAFINMNGRGSSWGRSLGMTTLHTGSPVSPTHRDPHTHCGAYAATIGEDGTKTPNSRPARHHLDSHSIVCQAERQVSCSCIKPKT